MKIDVHNPNKLPLVVWRDLAPLQGDLKDHLPEDWEKLWQSILTFGFFVPFYVWRYAGDGTENSARDYIIDGHQRQGVLLAHDVENKRLPGLIIEAETLAEAKRKLLVITSQYATVTPEGFATFTADLDTKWVTDSTRFDVLALNLAPLPPLDLSSAAGKRPKPTLGVINQRFLLPPFSVLDARSGAWQARKNLWLAQDIASYEGRGEELTFAQSARPPAFYALRNEMRDAAGGVDPSWDEVNAEAERRGMMSPAIGGTSIFDPVLAELLYRWFNFAGGSVLDPFAGGSVRGLVAARLGYPYTGIDLRPEQVHANQDQWAKLHDGWLALNDRPAPAEGEAEPDRVVPPRWLTGDSTLLNDLLPPGELYDFVMSCPPYADLEVYSDNPADLSTMDYPDFVAAYREIIARAVGRLKPNRFACFVVGEVRDSAGFYYNFVTDTIRAFEDAGARFYNDIILQTVVGSLAIRVSRQFQGGRKVGKALRNGTLVLTPAGWRPIEALCVGGVVYAVDGTQTEVAGVYPQGQRALYRVTFSDATWVDADAEHLWEIHQRGRQPEVMTTASIIQHYGVCPTDPRPQIPTCAPVRMADAPVPVAPYLLGLLLGDGGLSGNTPIITTADDYVVAAVSQLLPPGMEMKNRRYDYRLVGAGSRSAKNPLTLLLRPLGVMGKLAAAKFVPPLYLWNSETTRLAVLRGLMDADGSVSLRAGGKHAITEFYSVSRQLADDVAFLARSLGALVRISTKQPTYTHKGERRAGQLCYRVRLVGGPCPFLLPRKAQAWEMGNTSTKRTKNRHIVAIEPVGDGLATCIAVNHPSALFITKDFIVTHNTHQNVLVFFKGDPKTIRDTYGDVALGDFGQSDAEFAAAIDEEMARLESGAGAPPANDPI